MKKDPQMQPDAQQIEPTQGASGGPGGQVQPDNQQVEQVEDTLVNDSQVQISEAQQMQVDAYSDNATLMIYSEKSQDAILHLLQQGENPIDGVANAAFTLHTQLEKSIEKEGEKLNEVTLTLGAAHLVSELVVLADAAGLYTLSDEDKVEAYKHALRKYFEAGLADGSIDPVELQKSIEPLLNDQQTQMAQDVATQKGLSKTPPPQGMAIRPNKQQQQQPQKQGILGGM